MQIAWLRIAQMLIQRDLAHRRLDQIRTADDVIHALKMVIDHHRQILGKQPVAAADNEIFFGECGIGLQMPLKIIVETVYR